MVTVGLTGGIASGKSTVVAVLRRLGCPIIDADQLARQVVQPGQPALAEIAEAFGAAVLNPDGTLNRKALGAVVFADPAARKRLEAMTHPRIAQLRGAILAILREQGARVVVNDIPLLYETHSEGLYDQVWVVWVDRDTQVGRLMARDGIGREEAERRLAAQMPLDAKRALADVVIDNSGSREDTERQVQSAWDSLCVQ